MKTTTPCDLETLRQLAASGIKFTIAIPTECGACDRLFAPEDVALFLREPDELYAKHHGVTLSQFRDWLEAEGKVTCSGTTTLRKPCKNTVPGGFCVSPTEWVRLQGEYCDLHAGDRTPTR